MYQTRKKIDELAGVFGRVLTHLPNARKKNFPCERSKNAPPNPRNLIDLFEIPDLYQRTFSGDNFLSYDSRAHGDLLNGTVLVFTIRRNLEVLCECGVWYGDDTFKVSLLLIVCCLPDFHKYFLKFSPSIFAQLFTILGNVPAIPGTADCAKVLLPRMYALLSSKEEKQYSAVFEAIQTAAHEYGIEN